MNRAFVRSTAAVRATLAVAGAAALALVATLPAGALGSGGTTPFGLAPSPAASGSARSYFNYDLSAGQKMTDQIVISNQGRNAETLKVGVGPGVTSPNSGSAIGDAFSACQGTACWVTGLPSQVTLTAGASKTLSFTVTVPSGTGPGQYLAGISAEPANASAPVAVGSSGSAHVQAIIVNEVSIGVAVTIGGVANLHSRLVIVGVAGAVVGSSERLSVLVRNEGQTFVKGQGTASCVSGATTHKYPVNVNTVLPGGQATVVVDATGLPQDALAKCVIAVPYGAPSQARWSGEISVPAIVPAKIVHTGRGVYATIPPSTLPTWAIGALVGAGVVIVALAIVLVNLARRRRKTANAAAPPSEQL